MQFGRCYFSLSCLAAARTGSAWVHAQPTGNLNIVAMLQFKFERTLKRQNEMRGHTLASLIITSLCLFHWTHSFTLWSTSRRNTSEVHNTPFAQFTVLNALQPDCPLPLHYSATEIINKYDSHDDLQANQTAQQRARCMTVNPRLLPGFQRADRGTGMTDKHEQRVLLQQRSSLDRSNLSAPLPPTPFNTLFLLSFGNHIVWDCFLWEQEGVVEGRTKRLRSLPLPSWSERHVVYFSQERKAWHHCVMSKCIKQWSFQFHCR